MQLGCACAYTISKISENSGLAVFKARRDFRQSDISVCEVTVAFLDFAPVTWLTSMFTMV